MNVVGPLNNSVLNLRVPITTASSVCLENITGTLSARNSTITSEDTKLVGITDPSSVISFDGLNFCNYIYNYSVMGLGLLSTEVISGQVNVAPSGI